MQSVHVKFDGRMRSACWRPKVFFFFIKNNLFAEIHSIKQKTLYDKYETFKPLTVMRLLLNRNILMIKSSTEALA